MAKKQTKRERFPLEVSMPYAGMFILQSAGDDRPRHEDVRRYFTSMGKAMSAMRSMYRRVPLCASVARYLGIHPLEELMPFADGGYPLLYYTADNDVLCWRCANKERAAITAADVFHEGPSISCEQCNRVIESAYGDPDEESKSCTQ